MQKPGSEEGGGSLCFPRFAGSLHLSASSNPRAAGRAPAPVGSRASRGGGGGGYFFLQLQCSAPARRVSLKGSICFQLAAARSCRVPLPAAPRAPAATSRALGPCNPLLLVPGQRRPPARRTPASASPHPGPSPTQARALSCPPCPLLRPSPSSRNLRDLMPISPPPHHTPANE